MEHFFNFSVRIQKIREIIPDVVLFI